MGSSGADLERFLELLDTEGPSASAQPHYNDPSSFSCHYTGAPVQHTPSASGLPLYPNVLHPSSSSSPMPAPAHRSLMGIPRTYDDVGSCEGWAAPAKRLKVLSRPIEPRNSFSSAQLGCQNLPRLEPHSPESSPVYHVSSWTLHPGQSCERAAVDLTPGSPMLGVVIHAGATGAMPRTSQKQTSSCAEGNPKRDWDGSAAAAPQVNDCEDWAQLPELPSVADDSSDFDLSSPIELDLEGVFQSWAVKPAA